MVNLKCLSLALSLLLASALVSWGQTPAAEVVYVATGGPEILAVTTDGNANVTPLIPTSDAHYDSSAAFASLAVGPDNTDNNSAGNNFFLYACDPANNSIVRLRLSTSAPGSAASAVDLVYSGVSPLTAPVCGRVASNGDLYVSSADAGSGVYVIGGTSTTGINGTFDVPSSVFDPSAWTSFTGGGIAQKNGGDLLVVDTADSSILRSAFLGANPPNPPDSPFAAALSDYVTSGLSSPVGIARISTGEFFVVNQGSSNNVLKFNPSSLGSPTVCVGSPSGNGVLASVATSEDNFLYVGVDDNSPTKRAVRVVTGSDCSAVQAVSLKDAGPPLGIAVPPIVGVSPVSTSANTDDFGVTSSTFNFGSSVVKTLTESSVTNGCSPTVTESQVPISYLQSKIPASGSTADWLGGQPVPYNGEGGFGTLYTVTPPTGCGPTGTDNDFILGALTDATQFTNPRVIQCDDDCLAVGSTGVWPVGGYISGDPAVGIHVYTFSRFFLANGDLSTSDPATFCDFGSPLTTTTDPSLAAVFNSGRNLSVKFKLGAADTPDSCSNGPYVTDARALLSVARIADGAGNAVFEPIAINSSGNSTETEPIFSYNSNKQQYQFSLSLKGYAPGTYSLTVTFLTNNTTYQTTLFKVQ